MINVNRRPEQAGINGSAVSAVREYTPEERVGLSRALLGIAHEYIMTRRIVFGSWPPEAAYGLGLTLMIMHKENPGGAREFAERSYIWAGDSLEKSNPKTTAMNRPGMLSKA